MAGVKLATRLSAAAALLVVCAAVACGALLWMAIALAAGSGRGWRLAKGFDQVGNAMVGGDEDEVFSSRCWRLRDRPPYRWMRPVIDGLFACFGDADHCRESFRSELLRSQRHKSYRNSNA